MEDHISLSSIADLFLRTFLCSRISLKRLFFHHFDMLHCDIIIPCNIVVTLPHWILIQKLKTSLKMCTIIVCME